MSIGQAISDDRLLSFAMRSPVVPAQPYNAHVITFNEVTRTETWNRYWSRRSFRAAYDARLLLQQSGARP